MDLEDQHRFQVEAMAVPTDVGLIWISCDRCGWHAEIDDPISLADLELRADEHTEVCR